MKHRKEPELSQERPRARLLRPLASRLGAVAPAYDPADRQYLQRGRCFLCGIKLTPTTRTIEHVFPKWLLNRFELWDARLSLLNGTDIPYRSIRVPSCKTCNGVYLGAIERRVERAVSSGYDAFKRLPKTVVFQWLTKIFFQILYLEMRLAADVKNPSAGTILNADFVEQFRLEHMLLNSVRIPTRIHGEPPWSIFVVPAQVSRRAHHNFDFLDNLHLQSTAIRMGEVAVFATLYDAHAQEQLFRGYFQRLARRVRLHPLQFRELAAKVVYKRRTLNRTPKYASVTGNGMIDVIGLPLAGFSTRPIFDDWNQEEYALLLSFYTGLPKEQLFHPPSSVMTFITDERNRYKNIDIETNELSPAARVGRRT